MNRFWCVCVAFSLLGPRLSAQIPETAKWELTVRDVENAAQLPDMKTLPAETFEARIMQRAWGVVITPAGTVPLPFLRLFRAEGAMHAQLIMFWSLPQSANQSPTDADVHCGNRACVRITNITGAPRDWAQVITTLAYQDVCPAHAAICSDCDHLWMKVLADGTYRELSCNMPAAGEYSREILDFMKGLARPRH